ncbi:hypothetical protein FACS1894122_15530 [Alphaproteobacteria bacterium]|nr:hypothetical protein FACS1894122_15530 [Alphaproteobacteria bacterium]
MIKTEKYPKQYTVARSMVATEPIEDTMKITGLSEAEILKLTRK